MTTTRSLQYIHGNAYDTILLRYDTGRAVSQWTVGDVCGNGDVTEYLSAAVRPNELEDWDVQAPDGLECQEISDYGELVATITAAGLQVEDERLWARVAGRSSAEK